MKRRLREIDLSEYESEVYEQYLATVRPSVAQLRVTLAGIEARKHERVWQRLRTSGELDDTRLVEGVTGERAIYKHRGDKDPRDHGQQQRPKRLLFAMDVSASMYRFNGNDGRLDRLLESGVMIMEALVGFEHKYSYAIVGHSGESGEVPFVAFDAPPRDRRERLLVLKRMYTHSEYCTSGDHTLDGLETGVQRVLEAEADDYFVVVVSDANIVGYGLEADRLRAAILREPRVHCSVLFLALSGTAAETLTSAMPPGHAHICLDTAELPSALKRILAAATERPPAPSEAASRL